MKPAPTFANHPNALVAAGQQLPVSLESEIRKIYARSPLYSRRFELHADPLQWSCYREIPALSKKEIVENGHRAFFEDYAVIERGLATRQFEYESTGGTTQSPMTVIMEDGWWNAQTARAYRAHPLLAPYAGRPYRKCVLAPVGCSSNICPYEDQPFPHRYFDGTVYLNLTSDPFVFPESEWDRIVTELQAVQPEVIEGEPVYLSLLARAVQKRGVRVPSVKVVILTYGKASRQHAQRIAEVFPAHQVDLYGSTEAGYIFVGEAFKDDSRVIDDNVFVEIAPYLNQPDVFQIYVTTRDREAMPLLRYHTGDIVRRTPTGYRLLGREAGLYFRPDGTLVSPTEIDEALPADFSCWHYSLIQTSENRWDFHYVSDHIAPKSVEVAVAAALGPGSRVVAFRRRFIAPAASGKFALLKPLAK
ncbi:MAG: CoF synthetase [Opitutus sp.]|nr:CoF synthetase [Opitutus sp.]MCS6248496.1 CoF synthetase [Opitutus sp.]MCS6274679.1 CoF synthetase [Opitutus sp.]MCS6275893.1 CoF synthetase [Opitutus sp.]MCS6300989.1 CoF synthetase [Opitutus sp.]